MSEIFEAGLESLLIICLSPVERQESPAPSEDWAPWLQCSVQAEEVVFPPPSTVDLPPFALLP